MWGPKGGSSYSIIGGSLFHPFRMALGPWGFVRAVPSAEAGGAPCDEEEFRPKSGRREEPLSAFPPIELCRRAKTAPCRSPGGDCRNVDADRAGSCRHPS